ncbi:basement membrane-specific heparan sulfate proteoglycan core protein-like [Haemaphysalis longicornis]
MASKKPTSAVWFHVPSSGTYSQSGLPDCFNDTSKGRRVVYALVAPGTTSTMVAAPSLVDGSHWKQPSWVGRAFFSLLSDPPTLRLNALERADSGSYFCDVTYHGGNVTSGVTVTEACVRLFVAVPQEPPVFRDSRGDVLLSTAGPYAEGESVWLTCAVPPVEHEVTLAWRIDGRPVNSSRGTARAPGGEWENTLELGPLRREHLFSNVSCLATSDVSLPAESSVLLDMFLAPTEVSVWSWPSDKPDTSSRIILGAAATLSPSLTHPSTFLLVGSAAQAEAESVDNQAIFNAADMKDDFMTRFYAPHSFQCEATGSRPRANVTWFLDGRPLDGRFSHTRFEENVTASLLLLPASEQRGKLLECRATNNNMPADRAALSRYLPLDDWSEPEVDLKLGEGLNPSHIVEGADVYMECSVMTASRVTDVTWHHDGRHVTAAPAEGILVTLRYLVIRGVAPVHAGRYTCRVTGADGKNTESTPFDLSVKYPPRCDLDGYQTLHVTTGQAANVTCGVSAEPSDSLRYFWLFSNDTDGTTDNKKERRGVTSKPAVRPQETDTSRLEIIAQTSLFDAVLACWAENAVGRQRKPCRFKFSNTREGSPASGLRCSVGNYTDSSFSLTCAASTSGDLLSAPLKARGQRRLRVEVFDSAGQRNMSERSFWSRDMGPVFVTRLRPATDYLVVVRMPPDLSFRTYVRTLSPAQTVKDRGGFKRSSPQGHWSLTLSVAVLGCCVAALIVTVLSLYIVHAFKRRRRKKPQSVNGISANAISVDVETAADIRDHKICAGVCDKC